MPAHQFKVPATSANLGPGFDSVGLALGKYLSIEAEPGDRWEVRFRQPFLEVLPSDGTNLVIDTAVRIAEKYGCTMPKVKVIMGSEIPLTHGLGSSSSAIVAGIELADRFCNLGLSEFDKVKCGTELEGHPDNIGPAVTGGLFVGSYHDGVLHYETAALEGLSFIITVPPYEINTNEVRAAMPDEYTKQDAVYQNAVGNVLMMAIMSGNYTSMGELMMKDRYHEPYRKHLIEEYDAVRETALDNGAYATVISGAGPTLLTVCKKERAMDVLSALEQIESCRHEIIAVHNK